MDETLSNWDDLRLFLAVANEGGLAGATAVTGKSAPTLGRRMLDLERRLGRELFFRMPRGYALTDDGRELLALATELDQRIASAVPGPGGRQPPLVKVSAGTWVTYYLCRQLGDIVDDDTVRLRFIAADEVLDIGHREAAIGIRNRRPTQLGLAGRRVASVRFAVYAVSDEVKIWARVLNATPSSRWAAEHIGARHCVEVTNPRTALDMALTGQVRTVLPTFVGDRQAGLRRLTPELEALSHEQWLVTHHEDRHRPEVRQVIERLYAVLTTAPRSDRTATDGRGF